MSNPLPVPGARRTRRSVEECAGYEIGFELFVNHARIAFGLRGDLPGEPARRGEITAE